MTEQEKYKSACFLLSILLIICATTHVIHRRDSDRKIEKLENQIVALLKQSAQLQDNLLDTERRITRVESQFWE